MATEMMRLEALARDGCKPLLPSLDQWRQRAIWRRALRSSDGDAAVIREERLLPPMPCDFAPNFTS